LQPSCMPSGTGSNVADNSQGAGIAGVTHFCTYFDRNYLLKGLALYASLVRHCRAPFRLWVLCFDDETLQLLTELQLPGLTAVREEDFEANDDELLLAKSNRSRVEYFWTCTPTLLLYLLRQHDDMAEITYLDADLLFYSDPRPLLEELQGGSVLIVGHRFSPEYQYLEVEAGTYNVGWLSVRRDVAGLACLSSWRRMCNEWCRAIPEDGKYGDQKYLDDWPRNLAGIVVASHPGAGVAPWNLSRFRCSAGPRGLLVDGAPLIFFHFHSLHAFGSWTATLVAPEYEVRPWHACHIFRPYLRQLREARMRWDPGEVSGGAGRPALRESLRGVLTGRMLLQRPAWLGLAFFTVAYCYRSVRRWVRAAIAGRRPWSP
jgi:hypothetical protein